MSVSKYRVMLLMGALTILLVITICGIVAFAQGSVELLCLAYYLTAAYAATAYAFFEFYMEWQTWDSHKKD